MKDTSVLQHFVELPLELWRAIGPRDGFNQLLAPKPQIRIACQFTQSRGHSGDPKIRRVLIYTGHRMRLARDCGCGRRRVWYFPRCLVAVGAVPPSGGGLPGQRHFTFRAGLAIIRVCRNVAVIVPRALRDAPSDAVQ